MRVTDDLLRGDAMALGEAMTLALAYAQAGVPAFPVVLTWNDHKHTVDKVPLTEHGFKDASCDPREVRRMFNKTRRLQPDEAYGVGLWPGPAGYVVLDVDTKNGARGDDELARLEDAHGALPDSLSATTVSGGAQIWLGKNGQHIGGADLAPDVEIRADNGYVMAPGVWCPWGEWAWDGGIGLVDGGKVDAAPRWMLDQLAAAATATETVDAATTEVHADDLPSRVRQMLTEEAVPGKRSERIYAFVCVAIEEGMDDGAILGALHLFPPADDKGQVDRHGRLAIAKARAKGVQPLDAPEDDGARDLTEDELDAIEARQRHEPRQSDAAQGDDAADTSTSWTPVDLTDALDGADVPKPEILVRTDRVALCYRARIHGFQGEPETLKSWGAAVAAHQVMEDGEDVLWIDFEDDERGVVGRHRALGTDVDTIRQHFVYIRPDEPLCAKHGEATAGNVELGQLLEHRTFALAVIDGVTEAMVTEGLDLNSNADVATWMRRLPRRLADTGAAVIVLDHLTKNRDGASRFAIGAQHKLSGLTGAAYRFDLIRPLARATEPVEGLVNITVTKDRPGYVRAIATDGRVASLELTAWPDGAVTAALSPFATNPAPNLALVRRIAAYLDQYEGSSKKVIEENVTGNAGQIRDALRWMAGEQRGWVRIEPKGMAHLHFLTDAGRDLL
jgi:Bifunctional DNA primase/polymerase, N-terminal/AAA domain